MTGIEELALEDYYQFFTCHIFVCELQTGVQAR
jgi:hypothetical protein